MTPTKRHYDINFRERETRTMLENWQRPASTAVVGIGSVGKSNFIQHATRPEVLRHYLPDEIVKSLRVVVVDANLLGALTSDKSDPLRFWAGYELLFNRLYLSLYPFDDLTAAESQRMFDMYNAIYHVGSVSVSHVALRYFELAIDMLLRKGMTLIVLFDEFEELLREMPPRFFQTLRGIRDAHKSQIAYTTFSRAPLFTLVERFGLPLLEVEAFVELFNDGTMYLVAYSERDAAAILTQFAARRNTQYPPAVLTALQQATGNFAGLLRVGYATLETIGSPIPHVADELTVRLLARTQVRAECRGIWMSLSLVQQDVLRAVVRISDYRVNADSQEAIALLMQKGLLHLDQGRQNLVIEPPIFRRFVETMPRS